MLCRECQHELPDNSRFCGFCGAKLFDSSSSASRPAAQEKELSPNPTVIGVAPVSARLDKFDLDQSPKSDASSQLPPADQNVAESEKSAVSDQPDAASGNDIASHDSAPFAENLPEFKPSAPVFENAALSNASDFVTPSVDLMSKTLAQPGELISSPLSSAAPAASDHQYELISTGKSDAVSSSESALDTDDDEDDEDDDNAHQITENSETPEDSSESEDMSAPSLDDDDDDDEEIKELERQLLAARKAKALRKEKARREAEEAARREAEEAARREAEEAARREAEEAARREAEEAARREAEEAALREERERRAAEEKSRIDAENKARREAEARDQQQIEQHQQDDKSEANGKHKKKNKKNRRDSSSMDSSAQSGTPSVDNIKSENGKSSDDSKTDTSKSDESAISDKSRSAAVSQTGESVDRSPRLSDQYDSIGRRSAQFYGNDEGEFDQSNELEFFGGRMSQQFTALDPELLKAKNASHSSKTTILIVVLILLIATLVVLYFVL